MVKKCLLGSWVRAPYKEGRKKIRKKTHDEVKSTKKTTFAIQIKVCFTYSIYFFLKS